MLIEPHQLSQHLEDPAWVVFDCRHDLIDHARGARVYATSHLAGAHFAPVESMLSGAKTGKNGRHPLPPPADLAAFLGRHGVTPATQIVAYDDAGGQYAARLWWLAKWIGLTKVRVLDGGWSKWLAEGRPVTSTPSSIRAAGSPVPRPDAAMVWSVAEVVAGLAGGDCLLLDARAAERFRGESEPVDPVAGRIPGARNRFFRANLRADLTMRPPGELRREFSELLGSRRPDQVVHHCGSGVTACVNLLAMELAGLAGSRLYAGSWSEWIADPLRPVARG